MKYLFLISVLFFGGCHNNESEPNCGDVELVYSYYNGPPIPLSYGRIFVQYIFSLASFDSTSNSFEFYIEGSDEPLAKILLKFPIRSKGKIGLFGCKIPIHRSSELNRMLKPTIVAIDKEGNSCSVGMSPKFKTCKFSQCFSPFDSFFKDLSQDSVSLLIHGNWQSVSLRQIKVAEQSVVPLLLN